MLLHSCVSALVKRKIVAKKSITNGGMYSARLCLSMCLCFWVHTYGSVDVRLWGCICTLALKAAGARTWLITCVLCWKSFKLKQNGLQNIWLHQTCSVQCEVDEMWQSFLFWLRPCNLFHSNIFAWPCQCTRMPSLWVNRHGIIHYNWAHWGAIKKGHAFFMQCFTGTPVLCHNCLHWRNILLQNSDAACTAYGTKKGITTI